MSRWGRRILYAVGGIVGVVVIAAGGLYASSSSKVSRLYDVPLTELPVPKDSATVARGEHLVRAVGKCVDCHGDNLAGAIMIDDPKMGRLAASNLTSAGVGGSYSDAEMIRAIRHGVKRDGRGTAIMPSDAYQYLSDEDVVAIVAYVRSVPPVENTLPAMKLGPLGRALVGAGAMPLVTAEQVDHARVQPKSMVPDTTLEYGLYMANTGGCTSCHGPNLSGGPGHGPPGSPPAANLTPTGIGRYTDAQLETILRTGTRPDGSKLSDEMPWRAVSLLTPVEMRATIKYLRSVAPAEFGVR